MSEYNIAQVGAFDFENYGDILFPYVFENNIKKYLEVKEITLFAPTHGIMPFTKERQVYSVEELEQMHKIKHFDAIVVGGGDLGHFQKIMVSLPAISDEMVLYNVLYMWVIPCIVAYKYDIPLIWNAPGVPIRLSDTESRIMTELLKSVDYISVRDDLSKEYMGTAAEKLNVRVVPDTVLSIRNLIGRDKLSEIFKKTEVYSEKEYIIFHANRTFMDEDIKKCAESLINIKRKYGYEILLMPIGYALNDMQTLRKLKELHPDDFILAEKKMTQFEMLSVVANAKCYIGASLHGCITATAYGVKNIVYSYNNYNKIEGFLKLIGKTDLIVYKAEDLCDKFDNVINGDVPDIENAVAQIEEHFKNVAETIILHKENCIKRINDVECAEYLYTNSQNEISLSKMNNEMKLKDNHIDNLTAVINDRDMVIQGLQKDAEIKNGIIADKDVHINNISNALEATRQHAENLQREFQRVSDENARIFNSKIWKMTKPLRWILKKIKKTGGKE